MKKDGIQTRNRKSSGKNKKNKSKENNTSINHSIQQQLYESSMTSQTILPEPLYPSPHPSSAEIQQACWCERVTYKCQRIQALYMTVFNISFCNLCHCFYPKLIPHAHTRTHTYTSAYFNADICSFYSFEFLRLNMLLGSKNRSTKFWTFLLWHIPVFPPCDILYGLHHFWEF